MKKAKFMKANPSGPLAAARVLAGALDSATTAGGRAGSPLPAAALAPPERRF